jgi:hypothetical protein
VGLDSKDVAQNLLISLSSSFQTAPAFWLDPKNGVSYNVAVQTPQYRNDTFQDLQNTPVTSGSPNAPPQILGNLVQTSTRARPAVISHYNVQPMINVYAAVDGRDLGGVSDEVVKRVKAIEPELPRGSHIVMRGQVETMQSSFKGLAFGLVGAILLVYLLIVVNFQSWLDPFIGGHLLDTSVDSHYVKCTFTHGRNHERRGCDRKQYLDGFVCARADERREKRARRGLGGRVRAHEARYYDRIGNDYRYGADGDWNG